MADMNPVAFSLIAITALCFYFAFCAWIEQRYFDNGDDE